jgi:hypothetical protein
VPTAKALKLLTAAANGTCKPHGFPPAPRSPGASGNPYLTVPTKFEIMLALVWSERAPIILAAISGSFTSLMLSRAKSTRRSTRTRAMPACRERPQPRSRCQ